MASNIYRCEPSVERYRPQIDFLLKSNQANDWYTVGRVVVGELPISAYPENVAITVWYPNATKWDSYLDAIPRNLFSE